MNINKNKDQEIRQLKEELKNRFRRRDGHLFGCTYDIYSWDIESDFCSCSRERKRLLEIINS